MSSEFAVIGLGIFGRSVARGLTRLGQRVLAIDTREKEVQNISSEVDAAVIADATDESILRSLGVDRTGCAVVAIGMDSIESSILTTALLQQMGVPRIVARAVDRLHARVLTSVGAHEVISPEREIGERVARRLSQPRIVDHFDLGGEVEVAELELPEAWVGQNLLELELRRRFSISVIALRRGATVRSPVDPETPLASGDFLVVVGLAKRISRIATLA